MLTLTRPAAEYLVRARESGDVADDATLRIASPSNGDTAGYSVGFVDEPLVGDDVGQAHGMPLCVAPDVAPALDGSAIDIVREGDRMRLVVVPAD